MLNFLLVMISWMVMLLIQSRPNKSSQVRGEATAPIPTIGQYVAPNALAAGGKVKAEG